MSSHSLLQGNLSDPEIKPGIPALAGKYFTICTTREALSCCSEFYVTFTTDLGYRDSGAQEDRLPLLHLEPKILAPDPATPRGMGLFSPRTLSLDPQLPPLS